MDEEIDQYSNPRRGRRYRYRSDDKNRTKPAPQIARLEANNADSRRAHPLRARVILQIGFRTG